MNQREQIVNEALTWLRTPYRHKARVKGAGVDCAQLLIGVYSACGLIEPNLTVDDYPMDWHLHRDEERYLNHVLAHAHEVSDPQPGDVALFKFGRTVSHGAIVMDWPYIIHAYRPDRMCTISDVSTSAELTDRLVGFFSLNCLSE